MSEPTPAEYMARCADNAIAMARDVHGVRLDYSWDSMEIAQRLVARLAAERPKRIVARWLGRSPSADEVKTVALLLGGYFGELIRQTRGGEWRLEPQSGACGVWRDGEWYFPVQKVHVQLMTGESFDLAAPSSPADLRP